MVPESLSINREKQEDQRSQPTYDHQIDWESLVYRLDDVDAKILKLFYYPKQTCFILDELVKRARTTGASKTTIWRRVERLSRIGLLVKIDKSKPLAIQSNIHISQANVMKLISLLCAKYGLEGIDGSKTW